MAQKSERLWFLLHDCLPVVAEERHSPSISMINLEYLFLRIYDDWVQKHTANFSCWFLLKYMDILSYRGKVAWFKQSPIGERHFMACCSKDLPELLRWEHALSQKWFLSLFLNLSMKLSIWKGSDLHGSLFPNRHIHNISDCADTMLQAN